MFVELLPLIKERSLTIHVMHAGGDRLKVNVTPSQKKEGEDSSLSLPLAPQMIEGTVEEFDRELPEALKQYVANHFTIADVVSKAQAEVDEVKKESDAKVKAAREAALKRGKKPAAAPSTPAKPEPPAAPSLFDALTPAPTKTEPPIAESTTSQEEEGEDATQEDEEDSDE
jgi:PRTRC genetic system protein E